MPIAANDGVEIRKFTREYLDWVTDLSRRIYGRAHPMALEWQHAGAAGERPGYLAFRAGKPVGYAGLWNEPWLEHRGRRQLELIVEPTHQRRGVGSALLAEVERAFAASGAVRLEARVHEPQAAALAFLQARGFVEEVRHWELIFDLAEGVSPSSAELAAAEQRLQAELNIRVTTLAAEQETNPDWREQFHGLWTALTADEPGAADVEPPPFAPFISWVERQTATAEGTFLALQHGEYVGVSMLTPRRSEPGWLFQNLTGTRASLRRRGIAQHLKLRALLWACERGYSSVAATNASTNRPMLALNARLGFARQPAWITLSRGV